MRLGWHEQLSSACLGFFSQLMHSLAQDRHSSFGVQSRILQQRLHSACPIPTAQPSLNTQRYRQCLLPQWQPSFSQKFSSYKNFGTIFLVTKKPNGTPKHHPISHNLVPLSKEPSLLPNDSILFVLEKEEHLLSTGTKEMEGRGTGRRGDQIILLIPIKKFTILMLGKRLLLCKSQICCEFFF